MNLRARIITGYWGLITVIGCMAAILIYERQRIREIEVENSEIHEIHRSINAIHHYITKLSISGESVIDWNEAEYRNYQRERLQTDSLLQAMKPYCINYIQPQQIDTLCILLADKEAHLWHIMSVFERQEKVNSLLVNHLPKVAERATHIRTIQQKKKGIAGFLGAKKTVQILPSAQELYEFSDSLIALQHTQTVEMEAYTDSLRTLGKKLNTELNRLITDLDGKAKEVFVQKEREIAEAQVLSGRLFTITISVAIVLLFLSYLAIHREIKRNIREKRRNDNLIDELQTTIKLNEELTREKQNIIQTITHELRSPLSAIHGNVKLIMEDNKRENCIQHAETIRNASNRMADMVDMLLSYFRLDGGKENVHPIPFRLKSISETLTAEFMPLMEAKRLAFSITDKADEVVMGDKNLILRIGSNLLSNALKFTSKGSVSLTTQYSDGKFILIVDDTGTGIEKEKQEEVFKPFERLGNAATQDGFGLGLAIVRNLVELMDGNIQVESIYEKGSRFTVILPLVKAEEIENLSLVSTNVHNLSGCSVLSIDNDQMTLGMIRDMFGQSGVRCDICTDIRQLTERLRNNRYDLLTTDLKMSDISGYDVLELLRSSDIGNSRAIPIMVITGSGNITEEELKQKGFVDALFKPFSIDELLKKTEQSIGKSRTEYIDLSPLFTYGNRRYRLENLISETEKEIAGIKEAAANADYGKLDYWIHHIRSSWMLIRAEQPLQELYEALHRESVSEKIQDKVRDVLAQGEKIIRLAKKEITEGTWEEL